MKKILSTILAIVMIFNMGVCVAFTSDASATAEISSVSALPGDKVEILISMESADGIKTLSFLDFAFDSTVLTIVYFVLFIYREYIAMVVLSLFSQSNTILLFR